jgi:Tfp pilus assembly protein PilN
MRNLDSSPWLAAPDLKRIQASTGKEEATTRLSQFQLVVSQTNPKAPEGQGQSK